MDEGDELCLTATPGPESMLTIRQYVVLVYVFHDIADYNVFKNLTAKADQGYWSVVTCIETVSIFENGGDVC